MTTQTASGIDRQTPLHWVLDQSTYLRSLEKRDAEAVFALMTENREHLDKWLRWSARVRTLAEVHALIARFETKRLEGDGFHLGIWVDGGLAGGLICWNIHRENRNAEIGYWLGERFVGRGLATRAARRAVEYLFTTEGLNRVEMQCGFGNARSRAVPERLGFTAEGVRRQSHWITDRFVDHVIYGLLRSEWKAESREQPAT